jgi:hypothetical protein
VVRRTPLYWRLAALSNSAEAQAAVTHPKMIDSLSVGNISLFRFKIGGKSLFLQAEKKGVCLG